MAKIFVSGLSNIETTVKVRKFPIEYYPIDYPFFGVNSAVSGVGYNICSALRTLGDEVVYTSMTGKDFEGDKVMEAIKAIGIDVSLIKRKLKATPTSVVLYDNEGKRQIYCDLKDIQQTKYSFSDEFADSDLVVACNIDYNRDLLCKAKDSGKVIATDVHVLTDINDGYNSDFMRFADILFLSDEGIKNNPLEFLKSIYQKYNNKIIVLGQGGNGALMLYDGRAYDFSAVKVEAVNTVGAGDALFSGFVHYFAKDENPLECLKKAEIFASEKIKTSGASKGFVSERVIDSIHAKINITEM